MAEIADADDAARDSGDGGGSGAPDPAAVAGFCEFDASYLYGAGEFDALPR